MSTHQAAYIFTDDMFDMVSYNKGGAILHMLRRYLGDEAFFQGVTDYLKTHAYGNGEAHQLRLSFEKISGKDLSWFFNQWYFGYGNPTVKVEKHYDATKMGQFITGIGINFTMFFNN